ncbi:MAG: 5'/3'-nucleotidase SurE [Burkholderiales bacterium]|nr:5'/3'-nucleotidase SurE [Burkholderiales bacterium]MDR4517382.1 5'/3'-nucleotidase SurE [Nitrosomonas sp.]
MKTRLILIKSMLFTALAISSYQATALNIVLSNDDGWSSIGIQAMKAALVAGNHNVFLVAPLDEQSGSSAAINTNALEVIKQRGSADEGAHEYSVALAGGQEGAEPATTAALGVGIVQQAIGVEPDLIVSGINAGQNLGAAAQISGTVGGALAAINSALAGGQIPGLAISTDNICNDDSATCHDANAAHYDRVAGFTADLIEKLSKNRTELMPQGIGLNINYPALETVNGVMVSRQGRTLTIGGQPISITFGCFDDCSNVEIGTAVPAGITGFAPLDLAEIKNADTTNNANGYITIVPIEADYTTGVTGRNNSVIKNFIQKIERIVKSMEF